MPHKGNGHGEHDTSQTTCPKCGQKVKKFKLAHHKKVCRGGKKVKPAKKS